MAARLTTRDRELLEFVAEHRFVLREHVEALLGISASAANARLLALRRAGVLRGQAPQYDGHSAGYQIRGPGLGAIGSALPVPRRPDPRGYAHDVGLTWLWLAARRGAFGLLEELVSERHMRSYDGRADRRDEPYGVRLGGAGRGGRDRLHYPDLLLRTGTGHTVAVELELSRKSRTRLETILAGYGSDRRIHAVLYLTRGEAHAREISAAAARLGLSSLIHVQTFRWGGKLRALEHSGAREQARVPSRERAGVER